LTSSLVLLDGVAPIAREWEELANHASSAPFLRPGWFAAWAGAFAPGGVTVFALRRGGRIVALVPLLRRRHSLRSATNEHSPEFGLVAEDADGAVALTSAIFVGRPKMARFDYLDPRGGVGDLLEAARTARYRTVLQTILRSPYLEIRGNWDAYRARLKRKTRHEVDRLSRRLAAEGDVSLDVADGTVRLDELLTEGFALEASGWKTARGTAIISRPQTSAFYRGVARWASDCGMLSLAFLRLDGRAIAFSFALEEAGVYYVLKGGYDVAFGRHGPGILLRQALLARAFERGLKQYEFLGADEPWKRAWTSSVRDRTRFIAYSPSAFGVAGWVADRYARPVARRLRRSGGEGGR
jgi:CelD/BcsL family acetyltransferase involved in cellulose biosynthesis